MNVLFLDMDGVLNSNKLIKKWFDNELKPYNKTFYEYRKDYLKCTNEETNKLYNNITNKFLKYINHGKEFIFPELAEKLNEVINTCNLKIIWSSSWRLLKDYTDINVAKQMFNRRGLNGDSLIAYTNDHSSHFDYPTAQRVDEIICFIINNKLGISQKDKLGVIDDLNLNFSKKFNIKFFHTNPNFGITDKIKNEMIKYYLG